MSKYKYRVAAKDPCALMHLQKVLAESAAQLMQGLPNSMKRLAGVAAFNTSCPQRSCASIALCDHSQMFPVSKPAQVALNIVQRQALSRRKSGTPLLLEAKRCYWLKRLQSSLT